jgi:hypothetical protein
MLAGLSRLHLPAGHFARRPRWETLASEVIFPLVAANDHAARCIAEGALMRQAAMDRAYACYASELLAQRQKAVAG